MVARAGVLPGDTHDFPYRVHLAEFRNVGEENLRLQQLALVAAGGGEQLVDHAENFPGLLGDALARRVLGDLAREIDPVAVGDRLAHARPDFVAFDLHVVLPFG